MGTANDDTSGAASSHPQDTARTPGPHRGWRGLVADDYDRAVLRVAIATQNGRRQLLFGSVELLPTEIPSPPEAFEKGHFRGIQLSVCRVVATLDAGLDWYEAAWAGQTQLPKSATGVETGPFAPEPGVKRFALAATPPFSPTWHRTPRLHRLAPIGEPEGLVADLATGMTSVPAFARARAWLEQQLHFDVLAHDDWLGAVTLIAPNPLLRDVAVRITARDAAAETVEVGGQLRTGKSAVSLNAVFQERRVEALGIYSIRPLGPHGFAQETFEGGVADFGVTLTCDQRGILHENVPSWFMRGVHTSVQDQPLSKHVTVPPRKAQGAAKVVTAVVSPPKAPPPQPPITGLRRITELEFRRRRRFGEMRPLAVGPEQRDTLIFHADQRAAADQIRRLIGRAHKRLVFVDPYFSAPDLLEFATAVSQQQVAITVLVGRDTALLIQQLPGAPPGLSAADWLEKAAADLAADDIIKPASVEVKIPIGGRAFHDRFLIIDDEAWHCGHSFNKVGDGDYSAMTRIARPEELIQTVLAEAGRAEDFSQWKVSFAPGAVP
jgi:hypothetical protein